MTVLVWGLTFGGACIVGAVVVATLCLRAFARESRAEDAHYAAQTPEPVDRALWAPNASLWENSATPIFDQLSAENLRAELDDTDAVARWVAGAS